MSFKVCFERNFHDLFYYFISFLQVTMFSKDYNSIVNFPQHYYSKHFGIHSKSVNDLLRFPARHSPIGV